MNPQPIAEPELSVAIDGLWTRFLPEIRERVALLEAAANAFAGRTLTSAQHSEAQSAAHKLAGTLGTFGLTRGSDLARELEMLYALDKAPDVAHSERFTSIAAELRSIIETRNSNSP